MRIKHKYGCMMADGGTVKKKKPMKPHVPPRVKSPILEGAGDPGGPHTPGAKAKRKKKKKGRNYADGGKVMKKKGRKKLPPSALGTGMAAKAGEAVKGRQSALDKKIAEAGG